MMIPNYIIQSNHHLLVAIVNAPPPFLQTVTGNGLLNQPISLGQAEFPPCRRRP